MKIFILVPVFNRLEHTKKFLESIRKQTLASYLQMVVINDGSTDGTAEYLKGQRDVLQIFGDGNLWWAGSIQEGLLNTQSQWKPGDYVVFLNNDTWFDSDYIEQLVSAVRFHSNSAVGSTLYEVKPARRAVSLGPIININRVIVSDKLLSLSSGERENLKDIYKVDALSGRGTIFPVELLQRCGLMRPRLLPHYFSDYEFSMRLAKTGVNLLVSTKAIIYSDPIYGNANVHSMGLWDYLFSIRSSSNIWSVFIFYALVGSPFQRLTAPFRVIYYRGCRFIFRKLRMQNQA